jgi:hypothetical protein
MMLSGTRYFQRGLALAILILPFFLAWQVVMAPMLDRYLETEAAIEQSVQLLARYRANAGHRAELTAAGIARRQDLARLRGFLEGQNQPLAASALQTTVRRIAEANGGAVRSLTTLPPVKDTGYERLTARMELSIGADRLIDVLQAVETSVSPSLMIDVLDVRAPDQGVAVQKIEGNTNLAVRLDVIGYWAAK